MLPDTYYGKFQGLQRQQAFSIAGITSLSQLEQVRDSLTDSIKNGTSFQAWKTDILKNGTLDLPDYRLENIFRTNVQSNYNRGRWEQGQETIDMRPYYMYDAVNDSRTRPSHFAMDGVIKLKTDPFWNEHAPLNGYNCRCRLISMSEAQAQRRSGTGKGLNKPVFYDDMRPDKGWDYNPGADLSEGLKRAIESKPDSLIKDAMVEKLADGITGFEQVMPSALTTFKNIQVNDINAVLSALPDAQEQLKKVQAFTSAKGIKTLIIKQSEMSFKNKAAKALEDQAKDYLDMQRNIQARLSYTIYKPSKTGGFTAEIYNHVVAKGSSKINFSKIDKNLIVDDLKSSVNLAINNYGWTIASETTTKEAAVIASWAHEIGHQAHFWAKQPAKPVDLASITKYGTTNDKEFHAETFVAWLLNRPALAKYDEPLAVYFDNLIDAAIASESK